MDNKTIMLNQAFTTGTLSPLKAYTGELIYDYDEHGRIPIAWYENDTWPLPAHLFNPNIKPSLRQITFRRNGHESVQKYVALRLLEGVELRVSTVTTCLNKLNTFLNWLNRHFPTLTIDQLTPMLVTQYANERLKTVQPKALRIEMLEIKRLHGLLTDTDTAFTDPFLHSTPQEVAGLSRRGSQKAKTHPIPFQILTQFYQFAESQLKEAELLMASHPALAEKYQSNPLSTLRQSCLFIVLITTGMRVHELSHLQTDAIKPLGDPDLEPFYALHSRTSKTTGQTKAVETYWLAPPIAKRAIEILEALAAPLQQAVSYEIARLNAMGDAQSRLAVKKLQNEVVDSLLITWSDTT